MLDQLIDCHNVACSLQNPLSAAFVAACICAAADSLNDVMPASLEESKSPLRIPKMQQVLEWLSLLFDAHITSLHRHPASAKASPCLTEPH